MKQGSVLILYENSLFAHGLERLLRHKGVKVVDVVFKNRKALERIRTLKPDVVVAELDKTKPEAEALLSCLLEQQLRARVVRVNLEDNSCTSYSGTRCTANTADELLQCLLSSMVPSQWKSPPLEVLCERAGQKPAFRKSAIKGGQR